jgi:hypothetical protein
MALTQCPHCRRVQAVEQTAIGQNVGCMNYHCDRPFVARRYRGHIGLLSRAFLLAIIGVGLYLAVAWADRHYGILKPIRGR